MSETKDRDIVERLRAWTSTFECQHGAPYELAVEAADEISRLRAEVDLGKRMYSQALIVARDLSNPKDYPA